MKRARDKIAGTPGALAIQSVDLEKLYEIFVSTIAYKGGLIPHRLKIYILPRTAHICKLLLVRKNRRQRLRHLVDVQEPHYKSKQ